MLNALQCFTVHSKITWSSPINFTVIFIENYVYLQRWTLLGGFHGVLSGCLLFTYKREDPPNLWYSDPHTVYHSSINGSFMHFVVL